MKIQQQIYKKAFIFFTRHQCMDMIKTIAKKNEISARKILIDLYPVLSPIIEASTKKVIKDATEKIAQKIKKK